MMSQGTLQQKQSSTAAAEANVNAAKAEIAQLMADIEKAKSEKQQALDAKEEAIKRAVMIGVSGEYLFRQKENCVTDSRFAVNCRQPGCTARCRGAATRPAMGTTRCRAVRSATARGAATRRPAVPAPRCHVPAPGCPTIPTTRCPAVPTTSPSGSSIHPAIRSAVGAATVVL